MWAWLPVEMFVMDSGEVLVNESHHALTILDPDHRGNVTSQYEQHLRAILNMPLGNTAPFT